MTEKEVNCDAVLVPYKGEFFLPFEIGFEILQVLVDRKGHYRTQIE